MSINRAVLRLAMVSAVSNFAAAPWPTLAGPNVFDSKIEPIENVQENLAYPIVVIYTDYDKNGMNVEFLTEKERHLTVTIELLVALLTKTEEGFTIGQPETDSELELNLDILEQQVFRALKADNPAAECYRRLIHGYDSVVSRRGSTTDGGHKLAARQLTVEVKTLRDPIGFGVPQYAADFLTYAQSNGEYQDRAALLASLYEEDDSGSAYEKLIRTAGWSDLAAGQIGYERTPVVTVPLTTVVLNP